MSLERRVKEIRARARVRRWEYRQRDLANGAWARFREALAQAQHGYAIDEATERALLDEGFSSDARGSLLEPPRTLIWIPRERAVQLVGARPLVLRLDAELLAARRLALVSFDVSPAAVKIVVVTRGASRPLSTSNSPNCCSERVRSDPYACLIEHGVVRSIDSNSRICENECWTLE